MARQQNKANPHTFQRVLKCDKNVNSGTVPVLLRTCLPLSILSNPDFEPMIFETLGPFNDIAATASI